MVHTLAISTEQYNYIASSTGSTQVCILFGHYLDSRRDVVYCVLRAAVDSLKSDLEDAVRTQVGGSILLGLCGGATLPKGAEKILVEEQNRTLYGIPKEMRPKMYMLEVHQGGQSKVECFVLDGTKRSAAAVENFRGMCTPTTEVPLSSLVTTMDLSMVPPLGPFLSKDEPFHVALVKAIESTVSQWFDMCCEVQSTGSLLLTNSLPLSSKCSPSATVSLQGPIAVHTIIPTTLSENLAHIAAYVKNAVLSSLRHRISQMVEEAEENSPLLSASTSSATPPVSLYRSVTFRVGSSPAVLYPEVQLFVASMKPSEKATWRDLFGLVNDTLTGVTFLTRPDDAVALPYEIPLSQLQRKTLTSEKKKKDKSEKKHEGMSDMRLAGMIFGAMSLVVTVFMVISYFALSE